MREEGERPCPCAAYQSRNAGKVAGTKKERLLGGVYRKGRNMIFRRDVHIHQRHVRPTAGQRRNMKKNEKKKKKKQNKQFSGPEMKRDTQRPLHAKDKWNKSEVHG